MKSLNSRNVKWLIILFALWLMPGCATISHGPGFESVQKGVSERIDSQIYWYTGQKEDQQVAEAIDKLLEERLTVDAAVQIALLNNRRLQALYQDLGIAQADVVKAGLLHNPVFDASVLFPVDGGSAELNLGITQSFLSIFLVPLKKQIAESMFEEVKTQVTFRILDFAYQVRIAFYRTQADIQRVELLRQRVLAMELSYEFAKRLHDAGNITALALHQQRDVHEMAKLNLRRAETCMIDSREHLNRLMGIWGPQVLWKSAGELPPISQEDLEKKADSAELESRVIEASLELEVARQRILTAGRQLGIKKQTALVPELKLGIEAEKNSDWSVGPSLAFSIPFFNRGQVRLAQSRAHLRQQQELFAAMAVEIRSMAREAHNHLESAKEIAYYYQEIIIPLRQRIINETMLQYNAMQAGPMDLLQAEDQKIEAMVEYTGALEHYWIARAKIEQLLSGGTSGDSDFMGKSADGSNFQQKQTGGRR